MTTRLRTLLSTLKSTLLELEELLNSPPDSTVEHPDFSPNKPRKPTDNHEAPNDWLTASNMPEFQQLQAIVGAPKIRNQEKWNEWQRLVIRWGWINVIKAAEKTDPMLRWANGVEKTIIDRKKDKSAYA